MRVLILRSSRLPNMAPARSDRRQERLPAHTRRRLHQALSAQPDEAVAGDAGKRNGPEADAARARGGCGAGPALQADHQ